MCKKFKRYIIPVIVWCYTVVYIAMPPFVTLPVLFGKTKTDSSYSLYAASSDGACVVVSIKGEKVPPDKITDLVAIPRLVSGFYPTEELGGRVELVWTAPKDPEVVGVHSSTYVYSYIVKYDLSTRGYDLSYVDQLLAWWNDAQKVFTNHIWELPLQAKGQTFELYPLDFGIPSAEDKYKLSYGITDRIIITGLPKGEKIWIGVSSRDRYYNQSIPAVVQTYVPAGIEPPSRVTDLDASYGGVGTIKLTWTSPANDRFSVDASSGLYNIPDGRYCIAYSTAIPETLDLSPGPQIYTKWPGVNLVYVDTSTLCFVPQAYNITGLPLQEATTSVGFYFLLWTSDEWNNKNNWSKRSNLAGFGLVAPDYVRNIVIVSSASTNVAEGSYAILSWVNPKDEDIPIEGVKIYYSTNTYTNKENYIIKYTTSPNAFVTTQHYQLLPRHWYYYILLSYNSAGSRPWSPDVIAKVYTQYDFIAPDKVENLTSLVGAAETDGVYVDLSWSLPNKEYYQNKDFYIDGKIEVAYSSTTLFGDGTKLTSLPATTDYVRLSWLEPYTTYYIAVVTVDGGGNKSTSTITIYTPFDPYAPDPPKLLSYEVLASTDENVGSYVRFDLKNPKDRDLKEVRIYYSSSGWIKENYITILDNAPLKEYSKFITKLYPRTTYYFTFVSYDITNRHSYDLRQEVYIDKDLLAPEAPSGIQLIADAKVESTPYGSYVKISFGMPDLSKYKNFDLAGYEIYASSTNTIPYLDDTALKLTIKVATQTYCELLHLEQHTTYYVSINSFDPAANKSTSSVLSVFTWKDIIAPKTPSVSVSSYVVSLIPQEGVSVRLTNTPQDDIDLDYAVVEISLDKTFSQILSSYVISNVRANQQFNVNFNRLDVATTYYFRTSLYDWSKNVSTSALSYAVFVPADNTVPLYPIGLKAEIKNDKIALSWQKVVYQYNLLTNKIEKFVGINKAGPQLPTTFELYKYKIFYKQNLTDDEENWKEILSLTPEFGSCEVVKNNGYYKVVSYDISGNYDESLVVDSELNYYVYKNGIYVRLTNINGNKVANQLLYYAPEDYPEEAKGKVVRVFNTKFGTVDEEQGKFMFNDVYKFEEENIVGIKYKVVNGKANFAITKNSELDKVLSVDVDKLNTQLAFYIFDGKEYVKATTYVDKDKQVVYFKSKYLSKIQLRAVETPGEFIFVEAKPKVITPDSSFGENDIVFFIFNNPKGSQVKISIYDIDSILVWEAKTNLDSSVPGSYVSWDGKNFSGKYVLPGVYIYQVEAEGKKYKGTITVAR